MTVLSRLSSVLLVAVLVTAGLPPCLGMDMDVGPAAHHECCPGENCPDVPTAPERPDARTPAPECCAWGQAPDQRLPLDRPAAASVNAFSTIARAQVLPEPADLLVVRFTGSPPDPPAIRPHLLHSVLLI